MSEPNSTLKGMANIFSALSKGLEAMAEHLKHASFTEEINGDHDQGGEKGFEEPVFSESEKDVETESQKDQNRAFKKQKTETWTKFVYRIISSHEAGISTKNIRKITGLSPSRLSTILVSLKKQGKVRNLERAFYIICEPNNDENGAHAGYDDIPF